ncbi:FecR domain-containing protein [Draconibacterium orientale]|uniref:FecR family protein n=1 Tax=Draconibacterium orientale TaxID=1168034 RepID=UPI002ABD5907|nr:FecR domain-containing protein [Draconibacterium orientale]
MNNEKLHQFATNQLSLNSEIEEVVNWIESSEENRKEFNTLKNLWAISGFENFDTYRKPDVKTLSKQSNRKVLYLEILKYAAIFIFAFSIGGLTLHYLGTSTPEELAFNEIIVPAGESAEVLLADSTHVWLNSGSKLVYPTTFADKSRDIKLTGEAFFQVTHNPDNPFHVITPQLTVEVVGTSFNVEAFDESDNVNVTLVDGKVNLQNSNGIFLTELVPGEKALLDLVNQKITISEVKTDYYTSWKDGYLLFKNERLGDIAGKFERWFNVQVKFESEQIKDLKFTGTILKNKPIDQILDILKYTSDIDYRIEMKNNKPSIIYLKNKK